MVAPISELLSPFLREIAEQRVDIYNEFSFQHELGIFLRGKLPEYRVQFERNVSHFFGASRSFTKREIDIAVFSTDRKDLRLVLELKCPRNGQVPEQMFSFCKDIAFVEELVESGFHSGALLVLADDAYFYSGASNGIYGFFRAGRPLQGLVRKPTGAKDDEVTIRGEYRIDWKSVRGNLKYALVEVQGSASRSG